MAIRGGHGVTLCELHGEDVELHDSNTKANWIERSTPDHRRVVVTSRPIRHDETVFIKLSGTGGVRLGVTNWSPYADEDIANFNGSILFKDDIYEKSVKQQIQLDFDGENHEAIYQDEFGAESESMQRKPIPTELDIDKLFLFCEIKFGDIRLAFESKDGSILTYASIEAEQIRFDDLKDAMLTNTTGGIIIPDIEMKIDKPVHIFSKASKSSGSFTIRYGLTNISPAETSEETLKLYTIANTHNGNVPAWFKNTEVRTDAFKGSFTLCITKDFEIETNINADCEKGNVVPFGPDCEWDISVPIGPDLQKPVWLVLEAFQCDVMIELQHDMEQEINSIGDEITNSRFIAAIWNGEEKADEDIQAFVSLKSREEPILVRGTRGNTVLMIFKTEKGVKFLKNKLADESFWTLSTLTGLQESSCVLVRGIPLNETKNKIGLFFNKMKVRIQKFHYKAEKGEAILDLSSTQEAHSLCEKNLKYKNCCLKLCPYYGILYDHSGTLRKEEDSNTLNTFDRDFKEVDKIQYIREYQSSAVKEELSKVCSKIKWSKGSEVRFDRSCTCGDKETCKQVWTEKSARVFSDFISQIIVVKRQFDKSVWEQVADVVDALESNEIKISKDEATNEIEITGMEDNQTIANLLSTINSIKPLVSEQISNSDFKKLQVLIKFGIISMIENEGNVSITVTENGCNIKGSQQDVSNAKTRFLKELLKIEKYRCDLPNEHYEELLKTPMAQHKIAAHLNVLKVDNGIEWKVEDQQLSVWCKTAELKEEIAQTIMKGITYKLHHIQGDAREHRDLLDANMSEVQGKYKPYMRITYKINDADVEVIITCVEGYMDTLIGEINKAVEPCLTKDMKILIPEYIARYINDHLMDELELNLKREDVSNAQIRYQNSSFSVRCTSESYKTVSSVVISLAKHVHMEWVAHTIHGIDEYFSEKEGVDLLKSVRNQCVVERLTKTEMKNNNVHAVTVVGSGAIIFSIAGDITDPVEAADIVVNPTDPELKHKTGISKHIAKLGGRGMSEDCSAFREKQRALKPGEVYISSAGRLPYQKVFHVSLQSQGLDQSNVGWMIADTLKNILRTVDGVDDSIFRSIALPLLGDLTNFSPKSLTKVTIETLKGWLEQHRNIRQVFIYDRNPEVCRAVHSEMQRVFKDRCFSPPVQNVNVNKAKTLRPSDLHNLRRNGVRTIPLPGDKRLLIKWGELKSQQADVIVNITTIAANLSSVVSKSLVDAARSPGFDLDKEYEKEFKKGSYGDGDIVQTTAGRLPCTDVYHLKIDANWAGYNGQRTLQNYIEACLHYAIKTDVKSIAFPTIGTADCGYPKNEVAKTFLRTIGEFMTKRSSCKLEEIIIVIYKDDQNSTMHFESEISQIYSERPHRLEAIIEEALVLSKEGQAEEEKEKQSDKVPKGPLVHQGVVPPPQPNPIMRDTTAAYKIADTVTLSLTIDNIENVTSDVIICTTAARNFPNLFGSISTALKSAGGGAIQAEITRKYQHGIPKNEIAYTDAGNLRCQKLFYIPLQDYSSSSDIAKIKDFVKRCLAQAEKFGHSSICFPTVGTGNFKYPDNDSAKAMFDAIQEHFTVPPQSLKKIVIALFSKAANTIQVFRQSASRTFQSISLPKGDQGSKPIPQQAQKTGNSFVVTIPNTSASIEIFEGQLELAQADVILNTTTSFPNLNGAIPDALIRQGGKTIRDECNQCVGSATDGDIIETGGGNLSCNSVLHYVLPTWDSRGGVQIIQNCMMKCFQLMENKGYQSIALPAIGTGGYRYEPAKVAEGIYVALEQHATYYTTNPFKVQIVLFGPAKDVNRDILAYFQQIPGLDGDFQPGQRHRRVTFGDSSREDQGIRTGPKEDFVLVKIVSRDKEKITQVKKKIETRIKTDSAPLYIDFPPHGEDMLRDKKNMRILEDLGTANHVDIQVDFAQKRINFKGISTKKTDCREKVRNLLSEMSDKQGNLIVRKHLLQNVEWCYLENNGKILVPYPKSVAVNLQTEDSRGADEVKFKDTDGHDYVVDLRKMKEYMIENGQRKSSIGILKKDLTSGELGHFPDIWDPMDENADVSEVPLDSTKQEYKDILNNFKMTIGKFQLQQVIEIRRIQNKSLYLLYKAEKERLDRVNKRKDNEKILWHGTATDKEKYIISDGFNRSHAGDTFGGKVWYGKGVYFAVQSEYSADNVYSPLDQNGMKRMFQVKVLTGEYVKVDKGYADKVPPFKPGSNTEKYDSTCDDAQNPKEFVIYRDTSAYPEYIILFK